MTTQEFSIEFDILYNNLASNTAPPLNEYEKSVFLTKAQSDIVMELYSGRNNLGLSYDSSEEVRMYLRPLQVCIEDSSYTSSGTMDEYDLRIPLGNIWIITREELGGIPVTVVSQDEFGRIKNNPFKKATANKRVLRVTHDGELSKLYSRHAPDKKPTYCVWGILRPSPIILDGIEDDSLSIDNISVAKSSECVLHPSIHRTILERAVLYAKQAYIGGQTQE